MASSSDWDNDGMESLFEGMVIINPSQAAAPTPPDENNHPDNSADPAAIASASPSVSEPLDENLFSGITLITPLHQTLVPSQSHPSSSSSSLTTTSTSTSTTTSREALPQPSSSSSIISRQSSTRKKKRAGLRIGYGRDALTIPDKEEERRSISLESQLRQSSSPAAADDLSHENVDSQCYASYDFSKSDAAQSEEHVVSREEEEEEEEDKQVSSSSSSIELRFAQIKTQIGEKLEHAKAVVSSVSAITKDCVRRRRIAAENLRLASLKYSQLEKELEEACEAEDFETADRVSDSLASADKDKEFLAVAFRDAEADCGASDSKLQEVLEGQIAVEEECASFLQSFAVDAANNADLVLNDAEVLHSKDMDKWLSSSEALEVMKMELEIELFLATEARVVLNDSIQQSVKDDMREKDILYGKKKLLTEELEKLRALMKQKEAEVAENDSNIRKVEKRIADVASSFQEVQSSINTKHESLQSVLSQMELENDALCKKREEIDEFLTQEKGRGARIGELAIISGNEANAYQEVAGLRKSLLQFNMKSREDKQRLATSGEKLTEDVQMLKQEISSARSSLQELSSTKSRIQQEIESVKQRLLFIDKRVPELEAEKKVAATARNFKEAARIATETKALCVEKEGMQNKMEGTTVMLGKLEVEIIDTVDSLQRIEVQLSSKERDLAMTRIQRLHLIAGAVTAQRSAALEFNDLEEANILLGEAEAANYQAGKLKEAYNFKEEEFENLPEHFISMELVSNLGRKQLAELAASVVISAL
ncbi:hypothetical protein RJ639_002904 [Escallonia herrerae]|uniref:UVR domain-containing protein n=1 Tax=Escallonia herrerae TaxID=1293975 RepID=A0AA89B0P1_9ASTE|nr:hypothetical protein RJ639_002904 [Escallonia herrerae]